MFDSVLSDDVPLMVLRQLLQTFAHELGRLKPDSQKEISHYTLDQIQPRVVSFEEQVRFTFDCYLLTGSYREIIEFGSTLVPLDTTLFILFRG